MEAIDQKLQEINQKIEQQQAELGQQVTQPGVPQVSWWSTTSAMTMSASVLIFGLLVIFTVAHLIKKGHGSESILRIFGTILIIVIAVFLVVAGYSDQQIAPVMGLLGTIAGYLLGKSGQEPQKPEASTGG